MAEITLELEQKVLGNLKYRAADKDFDSVEAYIKDLLGQANRKIEDELKQESEEEIKEKLKDLGYTG